MSTWVRDTAKVGDSIAFKRPLGSFYLRPIERPVLFLAGGTGLAPFLSMLGKIAEDGDTRHPVHLIFGVINDADPVEVETLEAYAKRLPNFSFLRAVASKESGYPRKGCVTNSSRSTGRWRCRTISPGC